MALITSSQVAEKAHVSPRTVVRWAEAGHLVPVQQLPGRRGAFLFDEAVVDKFLEENTESVRRVRAS